MRFFGGGVKMKKYKIKDFENWDTIGYADTISELKKIARAYLKECDGDACIVYFTLNEITQKYKKSSMKFLQTC